MKKEKKGSTKKVYIKIKKLYNFDLSSERTQVLCSITVIKHAL